MGALILNQGSDVIASNGFVPVTITGSITDSSGKLASSGWIEFVLQPDNQSLNYVVPPNLVIAKNTRGFIVAGGNVVQHPGGVKPLLIWPNDLIVPANTLYQITIAPYGRVTRVLNGVLITQGVNPQSLTDLTFVNPQQQVVGNVVTANPLITMSVVPGVNDAFTLGTSLQVWANGYFASLSAPFGITSSLIFGQPAPGQTILAHTFGFPTSFPVNFTSPTSYFTVEVFPEALTVFTILLNGVVVGTVSIDQNGIVTLSTTGFTALPGDRLTVIAPDPADPLLAEPALTLTGTRLA